ncbi:MAG: hypothetical protein LC749_04340 [Actinobacteria bacterium]|nr:hypothetical protein [Actinomycetota bacterium]
MPRPEHDYLLALAAESGAECIVSGDSDLVSLASPTRAVLSRAGFITSSGL